MKLHQLLFFISATYFLPISILADQNSDNNRVMEGAKIYNQNCNRCHNPRLSSDYTKQEWSVVMPHMRAKAHLTGEESAAVEAFLASTLTSEVQNQRSNIITDKEELTGEQLVAKFACQACHKIGGNGGDIGPNLKGIVKSKGLEFVTNKLKDPTFNNPASTMPKFPVTDSDIKRIIQYLENSQSLP